MNSSFREQLFEAAEQAAYPAVPVLDQATGLSALDAQSAAVISRLFELFGVTALQASDADLDKIINTACTLSAEVAVHVHSLTLVNGNVAALPEAAPNIRNCSRKGASTAWRRFPRAARKTSALPCANKWQRPPR